MKRFFYFSKSERRTIGLLMGLVVILVILTLLPLSPRHESPVPTEDTAVAADFLRTVSYRPYRRDTFRKKTPEREFRPVPFDPNTADSALLDAMGLPTFLIRNILHYREKGGKFRTPSSLARIYGLSPSLYQRLAPYIRIDRSPFVRDSLLRAAAHKKDSLLFPRKLAAGSRVDLNQADTAQLRRIPGIGEGFARLIVAYRQRLGGYVRVSQLQEIPHLDADVNEWFVIGTPKVTKLSVNHASLDRLRLHPYLNFYQARAILSYRKKYGTIRRLSDLLQMDVFSEQDIRRLAPYLSFEE